jgi:hypothetical protein
MQIMLGSFASDAIQNKPVPNVKFPATIDKAPSRTASM